MKRARICKETRKGGRPIETRDSGSSISDFPWEILLNILPRLSIKRIFICKCVCKAWYDLISDPHFDKLHFDQAQVYPLLRTSSFTLLSRMLYLVEPEDFDMCSDNSPVKIKLGCKLKLPLCNMELIVDKQGEQSNDCAKLNTRKHKYEIVNSCNGLLCLSDFKFPLNFPNNKPAIICNPLTGEFINLPKDRTVPSHHFHSGFGFSPASNQYKVITMSSGWIGNVNVLMGVKVHVLGTESWRALPLSAKPKRHVYLKFPTYLNGCVYWFSNIPPYTITSFDIEKECFESISVPVPLDTSTYSGARNLGVLGGELFISSSNHNRVDVWVMKDNGANRTWSQIFSFLNDDDDDNGANNVWPKGSYQPIHYLNNGALLIFDSYKNGLICKDPRKTGVRYLKVQGFISKVEVIAHIPSFVPLKHALSGHNVEVLNIKSRGAKLKLHEEEQAISIVEENRKIK